MLKNFILISLFLSNFFIQSQNLPVDDKSGKITFMKTVDAKGLSAEKLYQIAKEWGNEQSFTIDESKPNSKIIFNGSCKVNYPATKSAEKLDGRVEFKFHFGAKEGKYRYIAVEFIHKGAPKDGGALEDRVPDCEFINISSRSWTVIKKQTHKESQS